MASLRVGGYDEKQLLGRASEIVKEKTKTSTIFDPDAEANVPRFERSELTMGRVLGRGGYCTVNEISQVKLAGSLNGSTTGRKRDKVGDDDEDDHRDLQASFKSGIVIQDRKFIAEKCLRKGKDARYAIKHLSDETLKDPERFVAGIIDLAIESRFLAVIKHPNIIKMRAAAVCDPYSRGYFVVLDRLYDTLSRRFAVWKKQKGKLSGIAKIRDLKGKKKADLFMERLLVAYDLCSALRYLHSIFIVYRDLKPDNIGFDVRGDVKIFDFGLAKELRPDDKTGNDLYKLTGKTGSLRYMAPEVAMEQPYNETVDVYSFGILMWQICSLDTPFSGYSLKMHRDLVVGKGYRPKVDSSWSRQLVSLMKRCWSAQISDRPCFDQVSETLRGEISLMRGEEDSALDISNRTEKSAQSGG